jgi:hypothetical protein
MLNCGLYTISLNLPPHPVPTSYASPPKTPQRMWT